MDTVLARSKNALTSGPAGVVSSNQTLSAAMRSRELPGAYSTMHCSGCSGVIFGVSPLGSTITYASDSACLSWRTSRDPRSKLFACHTSQMSSLLSPLTLNPAIFIRGRGASDTTASMLRPTVSMIR
jgi:hypothetical protein